MTICKTCLTEIQN